MSETLSNRFRDTIKRHRDSLFEWIKKTDINKAQICLCTEESIPTENNITILNDIDNTLHRIENNEFGKCAICSEEIENQVLELDFTREVCLDHLNESEKRLLERDLEMAAKVQRQLLPYKLPSLNGFQISVHTEAAGIVGGDYFDFYCNLENKQGIAIGDVMGKGIQASMLMANLQATLRILGPEHQDTDKLASRVNELFRFNSKLVSFVSLFLAKLDAKNSILEYTNAGHNPPIIYKADEGTTELLMPTGPAIGLTTNPFYKIKKVEKFSTFFCFS